ncbi:MAG: PKD domain-containing protein [Bacteroidetes bacterium]|nr:PKD domain-containing protein [Bacteroidota bacterium]
MKFNQLFIVLIILFFNFGVNGQRFSTNPEHGVYHINYGPNALTSEGDDDYFSIYYIKIPNNIEIPLYLNIFDMDCGRERDQKLGNWDTSTRFSLYGGDFKTEYNLTSNMSFETGNLYEGSLIAEKIVGWTAPLDEYWYSFAEINAKEGKQVGDFYIFKLVVSTITGDDGNVYDLFVSSNNLTNELVKGVDIYSLKTTFRLRDDNKLNNFSFLLPPKSNELTVYNFDSDGAPISLSTLFRLDIPLSSSRQDEWRSNTIKLSKFEIGTSAHVDFLNRSRVPNDITLLVIDEFGKAVPIVKPFQKNHENRYPDIRYEIDFLDDGNTVQFNAEKSIDKDGHLLFYTWYLNDKIISKESKFSYTFPEPGNYKMSIVALDDIERYCCGAYKEFNITINERPVAKSNSDIISKPFTKIYFSGEGSYDNDGKIISYRWDFGDGHSKYGKDVQHSFINSGKYDVVLTVFDNSNNAYNYNSDTTSVWINSSPVADAGPDITVPPMEDFTLDGSNSIDPDGTISKYEWLIDNKILIGKRIVTSLPKPGIYEARLKVYDDSGNNNSYGIDNLKITVNSRPVPKIVAKTIIAPNEEIKLDGSQSYDSDGNIIGYEWIIRNKGGNKSIVKTSFDKPGYYPIILKIKDNSKAGNSAASDTVFIKVNNAPVPNINYDENVCGTIQSFDASGSIDSDGDNLIYKWDFGKSFLSRTGPIVTNNFVESGKYIVTLTIDDQQNTSNSIVQKVIVVNINTPPIADAGKDDIACIGKPLFFTGATSSDFEDGQLKFSWDFGDGTDAEGINVTKTYDHVGLYEVKLKIEDNSGLACNFDYDTKLVRIVDAPVAYAGDNQIVCVNSVVEFDGTRSKDSDGIVNSYLWDFGDGVTSGGAKPKHIYKEAGNYTVTLSIEGEFNDECSNTSVDELLVTVLDGSVAKIESADSMILDKSYLFNGTLVDNNSLAISRSLWLFDGDTTSISKILEHKFSSPGNHIVRFEAVTNAPGECNFCTFEKFIYVNASPVAIAKVDMNAFVGFPVTLDASASYDTEGKISNYYWIFEDGTTIEGIKLLHAFKTPGLHKVILKVIDDTNLSNNTSTETVTITVNVPIQSIR